ncbi:hypothetical protein HYPSUDRAFT_193150 [Hypholoma sublateritium FD-334 SS-4]|uniref:Uncharacterized protein n=1 Tax=Hypholoma sublateritium (strain FD-334 SS-4) TaxID=945553 RepID=A0A0D2KP79_HYPSF|nr:hypothetical protein HYPSUDRAFT_193150 [Hypholoma sublateritium FD-334 SS-4]
MLSSLSQWSEQHIRAVFEAPTEQESLQAMKETFSPSIKAYLNGKPLGFAEIRSMILLMRNNSPNGLKIRWLQAVEAPHDACNRGGSMGGSYIISGILKTKMGTEKPVEYYRRKTVIVKIESQAISNDRFEDSRRIVDLDFVASDFPVDEESSKIE